MYRLAQVLWAAVGGMALGGLVASVALERRADTPPPVVARQPAPTTEDARPGTTATAAALGELANRVAAVEASVGAFARKLDALLAARREVGVGESRGDSVAIDPTMLQQAIETAQARAEQAKIAAMTPGEVLQAASDMTNTRKDLAGARRLLEGLLARQLPPEERQKALVQLGITHRDGGDQAASKQVLQQAIDLAGGTDGESGAWAAFQLAWTHQFVGENDAARQWFERVGRSAGSNQHLRIEGRWNAAKLMQAAGDPRAAGEFAAILAEIGDAEDFAHIANDIRARTR